MNPILEVKNVDQAFRTGFWMKRVQVLHQVNLQVQPRSIFGFLGANGAGKTTLIQLIAGIRAPARGQILVGGRPAMSVAAKQKVGYLPERPYFHEHLTGLQLLEYFGALSGMSRSLIRSRSEQVLNAVGMWEARDRELKKYSKGMLQRVGIAQAILHDPEFLVLDEPMSGLDPLGRKEIRELILKLASEGRTIFFSSHVIPDVEAICDRVALIHRGRIIGCGSIGELLAQGPIQTEIAFTGLSEEWAKSVAEFTSVRAIPDGIRATVPSQEFVQIVLKKLIEANGRILWVSPIRPSLEDYFEGHAK